ncbi:hypothetical protein [Brachyspira hampsonii]|uniref:hypothetical protein n=1 Tax=Brachyspira hampsonii TaxID=1287055 RepID=UPI000A8A83D7|nr:hypothetical protein [Brachyspira hampsonii]
MTDKAVKSIWRANVIKFYKYININVYEIYYLILFEEILYIALSRKIFVILTLLILFSFNLFANFKFGISPRIGADINIAETKDYNSVLLDPRLDINFQIGYGFKLNNVNLLSGIDLLFDFGINEHMVSIMYNNTSLINRVIAFGIYTGAALKFDLTKNNQHLLAGIALGV